MTTIAWDGNILAADSRTTSTSHADRGNVCSACGESTHVTVRDKTEKIITKLPGAMFRGEKVWAVAGAGAKYNIDAAIDVIRKKENLEEIIRCLRLAKETRALCCTLLIITEKSVFEYIIGENSSGEKDLIKRHGNRGDKITVAIGSGRMAARAAIQVFDMNAVAAVRMALQVDEGTGGDVHYVNLTQVPQESDKAFEVLKLERNDPEGKEMLKKLIIMGDQPKVKPVAKKTAQGPVRRARRPSITEEKN